MLIFESLPEIQRLSYSIGALQKQKQALSSIFYKCKYPETSSSGGKNNSKRTGKAEPGKIIQNEVSFTIDQRIEDAKAKLELCNQLQAQIQNQQFISAGLSLEALLSNFDSGSNFNPNSLPEWFPYVLNKQFDKHRSDLSQMVKKLYKHHCLSQKNRQLQREIKSFENLHNRYQTLNQTDRGCLNINSEAQTFQNRCAIIFQRFINFIVLIGQKIGYFVQENIQKALKYDNQGRKGMENRPNIARQRQNVGIYENIDRREPTRDYRSIDKDRYRPTFQAGEDRQNFISKFEQKRANSPNLCMNHNHYSSNFNYYHPKEQCFNHTASTATYGIGMGSGLGHTHGNSCNHHLPMHSVGFSESRFNYRDHMPKHATKTLGSFYF